MKIRLLFVLLVVIITSHAYGQGEEICIRKIDFYYHHPKKSYPCGQMQPVVQSEILDLLSAKNLLIGKFSLNIDSLDKTEIQPQIIPIPSNLDSVFNKNIYPPMAQAAEITGDIFVMLKVNPIGKLKEWDILWSVHPIFNNLVKQKISQLKFQQNLNYENNGLSVFILRIHFGFLREYDSTKFDSKLEFGWIDCTKVVVY